MLPRVSLVLLALLVGSCGGEDEQAPARDRQLLPAAYANDVAAARELIEAGADVDVEVAEG